MGICHQVESGVPGQGGIHDGDRRKVSGLSRHAGGHRLAHHDDQRLGVLGWGVGGIEAEAAMLGQAVSMLVPQVVGYRLVGKLREGATATDLVLTVTQALRKLGVVGKFVEFFGPGVAALPLADRATISNMAPEYGATWRHLSGGRGDVALSEIDGRSEEQIALVEDYYKAQEMFHTRRHRRPCTRKLWIWTWRTLNLVLPGPSAAGSRAVTGCG